MERLKSFAHFKRWIAHQFPGVDPTDTCFTLVSELDVFLTTGDRGIRDTYSYKGTPVMRIETSNNRATTRIWALVGEGQ